MINTLNYADVEYAVRRLPSDLKYRLELAENKNKFIIGGGFIRAIIAKEKISDIDIFATSKEDAEKLANELQPDRTKQYVTLNAISFMVQGRSVQIIHRWTFANAEEMLRHFDFTVAQGAIWRDGVWLSSCSESFYQDVAAKRLVYTYPDDYEAGGTLLRILKYRAKGYSPTLETIAATIARMTDTDEKGILAKLVEVDPLAAPRAKNAEDVAVTDYTEKVGRN